MYLFGAEIQKGMSAKTLYSAVYEDEPGCALQDGEYFKIIDVDGKGKVRTLRQLCVQK